MRAAALAFVAAISILQRMAHLPSPWLWAAAALAAALAALRWPRLRAASIVVAALAVGFAWGALRAQWRLADRLSPDLEGQVLSIEGRVVGLPQIAPYGPRLRIAVERAPEGVPHQILIGDTLPPADWRPGQRWRLGVKLRRPHGLMNPGGSDYEAFLLGEDIGATGIIVHEQRELLQPFVSTPQGWIDVLRTKIATHIRLALLGQPYAEMLVALVVGDESGVLVAGK